MKLRLAAAKLPLKPHEYAQSPVQSRECCQHVPMGSRGSVAVSMCSTWARCPARVALYYY